LHIAVCMGRYGLIERHSLFVWGCAVQARVTRS
jgi:hypothetical protein